MANVLVIGGAGYIGSTVCAWLLDQGHSIAIVDDLSTGRPELVLSQNFLRASAGDSLAIASLLKKYRFDCAMHFAARSLIDECFLKRDEYFENNVEQTKRMLETLLEHDVRRFVFSSSGAVFGDHGARAIAEDFPRRPVNPYGETKLAVEDHLEELAKSAGLDSISLRYFNAAGAEPKLRVGEWHEPETHLIPLLLKAAMNRTKVEVFGSDYPTPDGTCVRDYIHVWDLAKAHEAAMIRMLDHEARGRFEAFNLGNGRGFSVWQVIAAVERVTGVRIETIERPRRSGDVPSLSAASTRAKNRLNFQPQFGGIDTIVASAWAWEKRRRQINAVSRTRPTAKRWFGAVAYGMHEG